MVVNDYRGDDDAMKSKERGPRGKENGNFFGCRKGRLQARPVSRLVVIVIPGVVDLLNDRIDLAIGRIMAYIKLLLQTAAKEKRNGLIEACVQTAPVFLDNFVTIISGLPVNQFH